MHENLQKLPSSVRSEDGNCVYPLYGLVKCSDSVCGSLNTRPGSFYFLFSAAMLVFLAAAARAGIISADLVILYYSISFTVCF